MTRVRILLTALSVMPLLALTACGSDSDAAAPKKVSAKTAAFGTIDPGVLKVAVQPYAPYTTVKDGKIVGLDGDILGHAAKKLGLTVQPETTDFAGMLAGVQSRRVDVTIGGVAWTKDRQKQGLFTDPPYYSPPAMAVGSGKTYKTIDDLKGLRLGTVEGYVWVKSIKAVPGAKLRAYPRRQRRLRRPRRGPHRRRLPGPAHHHRGREGTIRADQDRIPDAADRRAGQGQARLRVLPPVPDRLLPPQEGHQAGEGHLRPDRRHVRERRADEADQEVRR
ncbi:transporter substrate-binding domain-containing protein [Streptomyces sp. NPDC021212]|uniref:transporter substrate-binding domain-containing protein n=1 Tax=Streptomyces sp. NPDC021212 TaxID=3365118 RepID=UPI0037BA1CF1